VASEANFWPPGLGTCKPKIVGWLTLRCHHSAVQGKFNCTQGPTHKLSEGQLASLTAQRERASRERRHQVQVRQSSLLAQQGRQCCCQGVSNMCAQMQLGWLQAHSPGDRDHAHAVNEVLALMESSLEQTCPKAAKSLSNSAKGQNLPVGSRSGTQHWRHAALLCVWEFSASNWMNKD